MQQIRKQIDGIDKELIKLLSKRMKLAIKLGKFKKKEGLPILDKKREEEMLKKLAASPLRHGAQAWREKQAKKQGLDIKFINKLYKEIFKESRRMQRGK